MASQTHSSLRAPSLLLLLCMIVGFSIARAVGAPSPAIVVPGLLFCLASSQIARQRPQLWLFCFLTAATLTAWFYAGWRLPGPPDETTIALPIRESSLRFEVEQVLQERTVYGSATGLGRVVEIDGAAQPSGLTPGDRLFFRLKLPEPTSFQLLRGSEIRGLGLVDAIEQGPEASSFVNYLSDNGVHHHFSRIKTFQQVAPPNRFDSLCQAMNARFESYLRLGAPLAGELEKIYIAMLLGQKAALTAEQRERFRVSGTMHFFAISGLHIGVIATVLAQFLLLLRVPRKISPFIGLPLLYLYVEITGASPSAVRAFLMALFFWLSFALTRQRSPLAALSASAVFVLILAPGQLWSLGFQLSYCVVLSILLFGLPLYARSSDWFTLFAYLPRDDWSLGQRFSARALDAIRLVFAVSFSAWLASAPLSAAFFGYFSPSAILLNVLLVNLVALAIITGVIGLSFGMLGLGWVTGFLNHAAWLTIGAMDRLIEAGIQIPFSVLEVSTFNERLAYATLVCYFTALILMQGSSGHFARKDYFLAVPPTIIAIGLSIGLT